MKQEKRFVVDILFVIALFCVFTVSALVLVSIGADVYQHTMRDMSQNYNNRTAISYISEKVRQSDSKLSSGLSAVELNAFEGTTALAITSEYDSTMYCTYLYFYDGYLRELFIEKGSFIGENMAEAGQKIIALDSLSFEHLSGNLIRVDMITLDGQSQSVNLALRCN